LRSFYSHFLRNPEIKKQRKRGNLKYISSYRTDCGFCSVGDFFSLVFYFLSFSCTQKIKVSITCVHPRRNERDTYGRVLRAFTKSKEGVFFCCSRKSGRSRSKRSASELKAGERCDHRFYRRVTLALVHGGKLSAWWGGSQDAHLRR